MIIRWLQDKSSVEIATIFPCCPLRQVSNMSNRHTLIPWSFYCPDLMFKAQWGQMESKWMWWLWIKWQQMRVAGWQVGESLHGVKYWRIEKGIKCKLPWRLARSRTWLFKWIKYLEKGEGVRAADWSAIWKLHYSRCFRLIEMVWLKERR